MSSVVVARAADIGMQDRRAIRCASMCGLAIEIVVENGFDRAVGPGADLERPRGSGLNTIDAEGFGQSDDAETRSESLLGMRPMLQDQITQERRGRTDAGGLAPDPLDGPVGITPVIHEAVLYWVPTLTVIVYGTSDTFTGYGYMTAMATLKPDQVEKVKPMFLDIADSSTGRSRLRFVPPRRPDDRGI